MKQLKEVRPKKKSRKEKPKKKTTQELWARTRTNITKNPESFQKNYFLMSRFGKPTTCQFWKRRAPTNDEDPLNKRLKSWI